MDGQEWVHEGFLGGQWEMVWGNIEGSGVCTGWERTGVNPRGP